MISMNLSEAASRSGARVMNADVHFTGCSIDSRTVQKGNLFIALRGEKFDGHNYISAAIKTAPVPPWLNRKDLTIRSRYWLRRIPGRPWPALQAPGEMILIFPCWQ